jgi:arylsulfatase A-like enzyme
LLPVPSRKALIVGLNSYCAPTRGAFQTGRFPYHLSAVEKNLIPWDMPVGIDLNYTMLPAMLKKAGYASHHIGKVT